MPKDYGLEQAEIIINIVGNIISRQVMGDTAKNLSDRFGKIIQGRESFSINASAPFIRCSEHLESAILPSSMSVLSSCGFVGIVANDLTKKWD